MPNNVLWDVGGSDTTPHASECLLPQNFKYESDYKIKLKLNAKKFFLKDPFTFKFN